MQENNENNPMRGATFLCNDCGAIFVIGPNNLEYMDKYNCYNPNCESYNVTQRGDLRDQIMIDNTGKIIRPLPKKMEHSATSQNICSTQTPGTCIVCGADLMSVNKNFCKNFHNQISARNARERQLSEIKQRDDAIRQDERDKIYKRLDSLAYQDFEAGSKIPVVNWPDIDCLFAELKGGE